MVQESKTSTTEIYTLVENIRENSTFLAIINNLEHIDRARYH